jgi:hypothetical protein
MEFELDKRKRDELLEYFKTQPLPPRRLELIEMLFDSYTQLIDLLSDENVTMDQLQALLAPADRKTVEAMTDSETAKAGPPPAPGDDDDGTESS